jgi:vacuolar protein sorting-associated protein 13A/C
MTDKCIQETLALSVEQLGMSLTRMGKDAETVRFLDDIDATFSMDSRSSDAHQRMSIELNSQPVVFRASYRDITLISAIVSKAIELYSQSTEKSVVEQSTSTDSIVASGSTQDQRPATSRVTKRSGSHGQAIGNANIVVSKEEVSCLEKYGSRYLTYFSILKFKCSCEGFRLVLIGDLHEQPMLHLKVKPFVLSAKDWSGEVRLICIGSSHILTIT